MVALEIAVTDGSGLDAAASGGADRVELCAALGTGGLTPSLGMIEACVERGSLPVHVLARSRPGDFVVDADHVAVMARDVRAAVAAGASGVVIGAALPDGRLDLDALARLVDAAAGAEVTLHRVFDVVADRAAALDAAIGLGIHRVLTSGGAGRAVAGAAELAALVRQASGRIEIMAGGGVRVVDVPALVAAGVDGIHLSARRTIATGPSGPGGGASERDVTDEEIVRAVRASIGESARHEDAGVSRLPQF